MTTGHLRLVAVVVTHNRIGQLKVTLDRLLSEPSALLPVIVVVDNASSDGTADWLAGLSEPRLDIVTNPENLGGAGGFEQGMRHAMEVHDPDWLVLMDDDARPAPGGVSAFHDMTAEGWDALAAAVYFPSGEICEMNRPSRNPFWHKGMIRDTIRHGRNGFHIPHTAYSGDPRPIDVTSFVGFFIARHAIERCGYPDGRLFLYGDDSLYTLGLARSGLRIGFAPDIRFEHDFTTFAGTGSARGQRFRPLWKLYYHHRNLLILYRMASGWWFAPACALVLFKWLSKIRHHGGQRVAFLKLMRAAVTDGLRRDLARSHKDVLALAGEPEAGAAKLLSD